MFFTNDRHAQSFKTLWALSQEKSDQEFLAALYLLAAVDKNLEQYIKPSGIRFEALKAESRAWSSGEKALLELAATVFNGTVWPANVDDVFGSLDAENFEVALEALGLRYGHNFRELKGGLG